MNRSLRLQNESKQPTKQKSLNEKDINGVFHPISYWKLLQLGFLIIFCFFLDQIFTFRTMNETFQKMSLNDSNSLGAAEREIERVIL